MKWSRSRKEGRLKWWVRSLKSPGIHQQQAEANRYLRSAESSSDDKDICITTLAYLFTLNVYFLLAMAEPDLDTCTF